jgi:hypothetical protein
MTVTLPDALRAWGGPGFAPALKRELGALPSGVLPLHRGTTQGGHVDDSAISVTVLHAVEGARGLEARVGVFFTEVVPACSCGDDPLEVNAYCVLRIAIDKNTAAAAFSVEPDPPA